MNSVDRIVYEMAGPHQGRLEGVPSYYSWAFTPNLDDVTDSEGFGAMTAWGQIYAEAKAIEPTNVRVEVRHMQGYIFRKSKHAWIQTQAVSLGIAGGHWKDDFSNGGGPADIRHEPDGGISVTMVPGYNFHFFPDSRGAIPVGDLGGFYAAYKARLIPDKPSGPNNLARAKFLANAGVDVWKNLTVDYGDGSNVNGVGQSRFTYLTAQYQAEDFYSGGPYGAGIVGAWTEAQLRASPPPA